MLLIPAVWGQLLLQLVVQTDHLICTFCFLPFKIMDSSSFYMTAKSPEENFLVPSEKVLGLISIYKSQLVVPSIIFICPYHSVAS